MLIGKAMSLAIAAFCEWSLAEGAGDAAHLTVARAAVRVAAHQHEPVFGQGGEHGLAGRRSV